MITAKRMTLAALVVVVVIGGASLRLSASPTQEKSEPQPRLELVEAARSALEGTQRSYEAGRRTVEDVYRWSSRLKDAQINGGGKYPNAKIDHLDRMRKLHERVLALHKIAGEGGEADTLAATEYYVAEATIGL